jgi:hypothetical protein
LFLFKNKTLSICGGSSLLEAQEECPLATYVGEVYMYLKATLVRLWYSCRFPQYHIRLSLLLESGGPYSCAILDLGRYGGNFSLKIILKAFNSAVLVFGKETASV